jgi:hypothetical protein
MNNLAKSLICISKQVSGPKKNKNDDREGEDEATQ